MHTYVLCKRNELLKDKHERIIVNCQNESKSLKIIQQKALGVYERTGILRDLFLLLLFYTVPAQISTEKNGLPEGSV